MSFPVVLCFLVIDKKPKLICTSRNAHEVPKPSRTRTLLASSKMLLLKMVCSYSWIRPQWVSTMRNLFGKFLPGCTWHHSLIKLGASSSSVAAWDNRSEPCCCNPGAQLWLTTLRMRKSPVLSSIPLILQISQDVNKLTPLMFEGGDLSVVQQELRTTAVKQEERYKLWWCTHV